ncbi:ParB/RepB/Spo0J family partition protein [Streptomyces chrestomyceticus]|uniref:ParB/RepB/Spo0J family partition protein n=1 Tax=Streptomyces chrestomyceticus TaxID=68185 RepID=UPI003794FBA1
MSRVADQLGTGTSFGNARPISRRRAAVAAATGAPTEGVAPPARLAPELISLNPDNPREALGDLTDLASSLRDHGQKVAVTVMHRDAYEAANPDKAEGIEDGTTYVAVDGSSRVAAAREAGLAELKVMVDDTQGSTADELLESALVANIHRKDLAPMEEARALERLMEIHESQGALAQRLHRSQAWVSQRLALLDLAPELQDRIGKEPIELLRAVGKKPVGEQSAELEKLKEERARRASEKPARKKPGRKRQEPPAPQAADAGNPAHDSGEKRAPSTGRADGDASVYYGVIDGQELSETQQGAEDVPKPRSESTTVDLVAEMPWGSGAAMAALVIERMLPAEIEELMLRLIDHGAEPRRNA